MAHRFFCGRDAIRDKCSANLDNHWKLQDATSYVRVQSAAQLPLRVGKWTEGGRVSKLGFEGRIDAE